MVRTTMPWNTTVLSLPCSLSISFSLAQVDKATGDSMSAVTLREFPWLFLSIMLTCGWSIPVCLNSLHVCLCWRERGHLTHHSGSAGRQAGLGGVLWSSQPRARTARTEKHCWWPMGNGFFCSDLKREDLGGGGGWAHLRWQCLIVIVLKVYVPRVENVW